jgi:protein gp37
VPFFFKQWGEWRPEPGGVEEGGHVFCDGLHMVRVGKSAAGRLLDGVEWSEVPGGQ